VNIGKSVVIKGELNGSEDLTIEGQVEGKIELRQNVLTIGANARIKAQVFAKSVIILGEVTGNVTATEKVDIRDNGSVDGDIAAPRVAIRRAIPTAMLVATVQVSASTQSVSRSAGLVGGSECLVLRHPAINILRVRIPATMAPPVPSTFHAVFSAV